MADNIKQWITVNGQHIPIMEGQSKKEAVEKAIKHQQSSKGDADNKDKQISTNKEEANKLNKESKLADLQKEYDNAKGFLAKAKIKRRMDMINEDWQGTEEEYIAYRNKKWDEEQAKQKEEYQRRQQAEKKAKEDAEEKKKAELEHELKTQPKHKVEQYKIVQEYNPMNDDYHVGIRKPSDIKTWQEAMQNKESFAWGDFTKKDAEKALKAGKITIYSSYPINQGVFISTSKVQSEQYAGGKGKKVYSKEVPLEDVAWIDGDEGQFAKVRR